MLGNASAKFWDIIGWCALWAQRTRSEVCLYRFRVMLGNASAKFWDIIGWCAIQWLRVQRTQSEAVVIPPFTAVWPLSDHIGDRAHFGFFREFGLSSEVRNVLRKIRDWNSGHCREVISIVSSSRRIHYQRFWWCPVMFAKLCSPTS